MQLQEYKPNTNLQSYIYNNLPQTPKDNPYYRESPRRGRVTFMDQVSRFIDFVTRRRYRKD